MKEKVRPIFVRLLICFIALAMIALPEPMAARAQTGAPVGTIAYVVSNAQDGDEIHLIEPDKSNDRVIYSTGHPHSEDVRDIRALVWKPDATELAFTSSHEASCSVFSEDIYTIRPGGSYRRITDPPACGSREGIPTGTVIVPVENGTDKSGPFTFYFEGAPGPIVMSLAAGKSTELTFKNVADYGNLEQMAIWSNAEVRAFYQDAWVDVQPGQTVRTGVLVMGAAYKNFGFSWPNYLPDGSTIASVFNANNLFTVASDNTMMGNMGDRQNIDMTAMAKFLAWGPTPDTANMFLFMGQVPGPNGEDKYPIMMGDTDGGEPSLFLDYDPEDIGKQVMGLTWLPDGSGFLYSVTEPLPPNDDVGANIWEFTFGESEPRQITALPYGLARRMSVSPDGQKIVFEYQPTGDPYGSNPDTELWMVNRDTTHLTRLVKHGRAPAWSQQDLVSPSQLPNKVYLPFVKGR